MKGIMSKYVWRYFVLGLFLILSCSNDDEKINILQIKEYRDRKEDFSIWQLQSFFEEVQMGYIIKTDDRKIIVIDGGGPRTAPMLEAYIKQLGNTVHTWVITHPHIDHVGALLEIMNTPDIEIKRILHTSIDLDWVKENERSSSDIVQRYNINLKSSGISILDAEKGAIIDLGKGVSLKVLGTRNEEILNNAINNSSLVFKVSSKTKSILFTGDLGIEGGNKVLQDFDILALRADYVQMAHHGQRGVAKSFYEAVNAQYALWPTPKWLWENNIDGKNVNSGTYKTLEVRSWMSDLGIKKNYVAGLEGTVQID